MLTVVLFIFIEIYNRQRVENKNKCLSTEFKNPLAKKKNLSTQQNTIQ